LASFSDLAAVNDSNPRRSSAGLAIGLGLIALAAVIGFDTARMQVPPTYAKVGPQVFPMLIGAGLAVAGAIMAWTSRRGHGAGGAAPVHGQTDWRAVVFVCAGLLLHMTLLRPLGFVPAAAILFMSVALAFGSRRVVRDAITALVLALVAYGGFVYGLGLQLPAGIFSSAV
jgi:putative tricarboxylic transport membrane protein